MFASILLQKSSFPLVWAAGPVPPGVFGGSVGTCNPGAGEETGGSLGFHQPGSLMNRQGPHSVTDPVSKYEVGHD